jgi:hypothetical protein
VDDLLRMGLENITFGHFTKSRVPITAANFVPPSDLNLTPINICESSMPYRTMFFAEYLGRCRTVWSNYVERCVKVTPWHGCRLDLYRLTSDRIFVVTNWVDLLPYQQEDQYKGIDYVKLRDAGYAGMYVTEEAIRSAQQSMCTCVSSAPKVPGLGSRAPKVPGLGSRARDRAKFPWEPCYIHVNEYGDDNPMIVYCPPSVSEVQFDDNDIVDALVWLRTPQLIVWDMVDVMNFIGSSHVICQKGRKGRKHRPHKRRRCRYLRR